MSSFPGEPVSAEATFMILTTISQPGRRSAGRIIALIVCLGLCLMVPVWILHAAEASSGEGEDIAYLDSLGLAPRTLKTLRRTPLSSSRDMRRAVAYVAKGRPVELLGWGEECFYVATRIPTGPARGWVRSSAIEPIETEIIEEIRRRHARQQQHRALIEQGKITTGMTREEVTASLGKPRRKITVQAASAREEHWLYPNYRYQPEHRPPRDREGYRRPSVTYRRVASGQRLVVFQGREVVAIENLADGQRPSGAWR